jgi:hypothetical protein
MFEVRQNTPEDVAIDIQKHFYSSNSEKISEFTQGIKIVRSASLLWFAQDDNTHDMGNRILAHIREAPSVEQYGLISLL